LILPLLWPTQVCSSLKLFAARLGLPTSVIGTSLTTPRYSKSLSTLNGMLRTSVGIVAIAMWCNSSV